MLKSIIFFGLIIFTVNINAASFGWAVSTSVLQESNVLHVSFGSTAAKTGLPDCATRTYIDITTDAGKVRTSLALAAFTSGKEVYFYISDGITSCQWSSSIPNNWLSVRN